MQFIQFIQIKLLSKSTIVAFVLSMLFDSFIVQFLSYFKKQIHVNKLINRCVVFDSITMK